MAARLARCARDHKPRRGRSLRGRPSHRRRAGHLRRGGGRAALRRSPRAGGSLDRDVRRALAGMRAPPGYRIELGGQRASQREAFAKLAAVAVGGVLLVGLEVKSGILLLELAQEHEAHGMSAVVEAGRRRIRPIMLTTTATLFGVLPLARRERCSRRPGALPRVVVRDALVGSPPPRRNRSRHPTHPYGPPTGNSKDTSGGSGGVPPSIFHDARGAPTRGGAVLFVASPATATTGRAWASRPTPGRSGSPCCRDVRRSSRCARWGARPWRRT